MFCLRHLHGTIGLDDKGAVIFNDDTAPVFNLVSHNDSYLIVNQCLSAKIDGQTFSQAVISPSHIVRLETPHFQSICAVTSPRSELLARSGATLFPNATYTRSILTGPSEFSIKYQLAGITKSYPLPNAVEVSLGSSHKDGIYLPIEGIGSGHLRLLAQDTLKIFPFGGPIIHCGQEHRFSLEVIEPTSILIQPMGIQLEITKE